MTKLVSIKNLTHRYDKRTTDGIKNISFDLYKGEIFSLIGPSGSGKSTTLKCIASLLSQESGTINFHDDVVISYVDQYPDLDEELSVFENLAVSLREIESDDQIANQIRMTLSQLEITNEINSLVKNISGGQKQRVIIAKALVKNPSILLLDEPFANLDKTLRLSLLEDLFELFKSQSMSVIWVTHNTEEALNYSQRTALLNFGEMQQIDTPENIYFKPSNMFTAQFFGHTNIIATKILDEQSNVLKVDIFSNELIIPKPKNFKVKDHKDVLIVIHPNSIIMDSTSQMIATVEKILFRGSSKLLELNYKNRDLWCEVNSTNQIKLSQKIAFSFTTSSIHCLDEV